VVHNYCWLSPVQSFSSPSPAGTHDQVLLSEIRDSPNLEGQVPILISSRNKATQLYSRHWVPSSSSPTIRKSMVEVFEPMSKLIYDHLFTVNLFVLARSPLRFTSRDSCAFDEVGVLSDERTGLSFTIAHGLASAVILWSDSRGTRDHI
jgi:hypothetical protein